MDQGRWLQIQELYYLALPLVSPERNKFVADACGSDAALQSEINSLLEADDCSDNFLDEPIVGIGLDILVSSAGKLETSSIYSGVDALLGMTIDARYEVVEKVGSGGAGDVYRAHDNKISARSVVIKILKDASLKRPWIVTKFHQEIAILTKIADPGVVGVIDVGNLPDARPYLVMEFVEGCNLRDLMHGDELNRGRMEFGEIAEIMKQVARTVTSAHDAGIIHRDLKPANIMVRHNASGDLQIKVIDFGIAKLIDPLADSTTTGVIAGTVDYMAPEQLLGQRVRTTSDVYALGLIAYEMVTGTRPFNPESRALLAELQRFGVKVHPKDLRPALPTAAQEVILKALSYHPADRFQRARDFGDALAVALTIPNDFIESLPDQQLQIGSSATSPALVRGHIARLERHRRVGRLKPFARTLAILLSFLLIGTIGFYFWRRHSYPKPERTLFYSLTVQKMRDEKPYQQPYQSSGQEIFENGYKFQLNVSSPEAGFLYVFNEGLNNQGFYTLTIIYPTPKLSNSFARIDANQKVQTNWNTFGGQTGTEQFYIIWSASAVSELEAARDEAFKHDNGTVVTAALVKSVRQFFEQHSMPAPETVKDTARMETVVKAKGDLLVKLLELEHR